ncbi:MAG: polysaccharide biosynthesis/export family protein [Terracidiphilus sp.]
MNRRTGIACIALSLMGIGIAAAQGPAPLPAGIQGQIQGQVQGQSQPATPLPSEPTLKPNPLEALRNFEPPANAEYELGKGDQITVNFAGRPDMMAKLVVGPDGRISLPLAGAIMLNGLTREGAAKAIESALSPYYTNLVVTVTVDQYTANHILLLGAVDHPGIITFDDTPTLLEALARGGIQAGPDKSGEQPQVNGIPDRCAIYRGNDQVIWVDLRQLIESGSTMADLRLRRDDVVYVPSITERFVSVLGQVQHPGAIPLAYNSTVASVLAQAGGFTEAAGTKPHIQIVDPSTGTSRVISMNDLLNPTRSLEVTLKPGEIIFVPETGFNHATYLLDRLNPLVTVASLAFYAGAL